MLGFGDNLIKKKKKHIYYNREIGLNMLLWKEEKTDYFITVQYLEK